MGPLEQYKGEGCHADIILLQPDREEEAARHELESAQRLLNSCLQPQSSAAAVRRGSAVQLLVERLQGAYADIWQLKLLQGLNKLKVCSPIAHLGYLMRSELQSTHYYTGMGQGAPGQAPAGGLHQTYGRSISCKSWTHTHSVFSCLLI